jgi:hypothetical protein
MRSTVHAGTTRLTDMKQQRGRGESAYAGPPDCGRFTIAPTDWLLYVSRTGLLPSTCRQPPVRFCTSAKRDDEDDF